MNNNSKTLFDSSLSRFVQAIRQTIGDSYLQRGVIVRDNSGRLSFATSKDSPSDADRDQISRILRSAIGSYARPDRIIAFNNEPGVSRLLKDSAQFPIRIDSQEIRLIDRRIVGAGWLDAPSEKVGSPPRIVFASVKGGVGRSTAIAIAAADLARRNKNVLVVDLDLEAPGLGNLLLNDQRVPSLGTIDFLVENGIDPINASDLESFIGVSELTTAEGGRVDVLPAFGSLATKNPENVLSKMARAMIEDIEPDGTAVPVVTQIATMIEKFSVRRQYDVILIDSRAGLAELTAPAILGLGASILLFGTAQKQTIEGYRVLLSALGLLAQRDKAFGREASWRQMLKAVHAKASLDPTSAARHRDDLYDIFSEYLYDEEDSGEASLQPFTFHIDDPSAPHWPLIIPFNPSFADFDSAKNFNQLTQSFYEQTYRSFMNGIDSLIENPSTAP
jgi:Mrp family chromosome partitioning ATPase